MPKVAERKINKRPAPNLNVRLGALGVANPLMGVAVDASPQPSQMNSVPYTLFGKLVTAAPWAAPSNNTDSHFLSLLRGVVIGTQVSLPEQNYVTAFNETATLQKIEKLAASKGLDLNDLLAKAGAHFEQQKQPSKLTAVEIDALANDDETSGVDKMS